MSVMKRLVQYFIDNSFLVNLLSAIMVLCGLISLATMKRDLISNWQSKTIQITANLVGAGPEQMERFVTYPLEKAVKNIADIQEIKSTTSGGHTNIKLELKDDVEDIGEVEQQAKDAIAAIETDLPSNVEDIQVRHIKQRKAWFNYYSVIGFDENSDKHQDWMIRVKEDLGRIEGIADIETYNWQKSLYIKINPKAIGRYQITPEEIFSSVRSAFQIYPLGSITKGSDTLSVEIENKDFDLDMIKNLSLRTSASNYTLKLSDVADVQYRLPKRTKKNFTLGKESVSFNIYKDFDTDSINLKERLEAKLKEINEQAPEGLEVISVEDGPAFILRQINALKSNALFGVILVILTLCIFLGIRNALMTSFGIPLAYLFTFTVLSNLGISIDLISVVGLLLVVGIIVDDAIIVSEQYMQNLEKGQTPREAATEAVLMTWKPICGTIATTMIAFTPLLLGKDSMSSILFAIPVVVFTALGLSLFESFFILPNHLKHFVKKAKNTEDTKTFLKFKNLYEKVLSFSLRFRYFVIIGIIGLMGGSLYFASQKINFNFNLSISSESIRFIGELKESSSIEETRQKIQVIEDVMAKIPKDRYKLYEVGVGSNYTNGKSMTGPQYFNYWISFSQLDENVEANKKYVNEFLKKEIENLKKTGLFERLESKIHKGGRDESRENIVEFNISSLNPFNTEKITKKVKSIIEEKDIQGIKSVDLDDSLFKDAWIFRPNIAAVQATGLSLEEVSTQLAHFVRMNEVHQHSLGSKTITLYTYFEDGDNLEFSDLSNLPVYLRNGISIPSGQLGNWVKEKRQQSIKHSDLMRKVTIDLPFDSEVIKKEVLIDKVKEIEEDLSAVYPDLLFKAQDADEQSRKNKVSILTKFGYAMIGIFFVLAIVLGSLLQPLLICSAIPFGIIGVIWAFYFQGLEISLMACIGIIGMAGVVVNDSLLLVVTVNKKRKNWFDFHAPQIIEGAKSRLRAIILTSITTLGGVFPMAYAIGGDAGFTKGLAMSMGWGLLFATVLTLVVLPCMLLIQRDVMVLIQKYIFRKKVEVAIQPKVQEPMIGVPLQDNKSKSRRREEFREFQ